MGIPLSEIDDASALRLDWLLRIDNVVAEVLAKKNRPADSPAQ